MVYFHKTVIAGAHNPNIIEPTQQRRTVTASNVFMHPLYDDSNLSNDITYINIPQPFTITPYVQVVPFARVGDFASLYGMTGTVAGWGRQGPSETPDPNLRWVSSTIMTNLQCQQAGWWGMVTDNNLCMTTNGKDSCEGDSGGGLFVQNALNQTVLVGLVSFGGPCDITAIPGVYTRVDRFVGFFAP